MALSIADRGYVLETGSIVTMGNCIDLLNDERVKKAYLGVELAVSTSSLVDRKIRRYDFHTGGICCCLLYESH